MSTMCGQPCMTHLVNEHTAFGVLGKTTLNQDSPTQRFEQAIAPVSTGEM